jgi:hypothetical protein
MRLSRAQLLGTLALLFVVWLVIAVRVLSTPL